MKLALSWSGGGIKAVATLTWAAELERRLGAPLGRVFDLYGGTSTGGIVSIALGQGFSAREVLDFYVTEAPRIFHRPLSHKIKTLWGLTGPKYPATGLSGALDRRFGEACLGDSRARVMVTAHELPRGGLVDGGVHALNPVDSVLAEMVRLWPREPAMIVAVGHEPVPERSRAVYLKSWKHDLPSTVPAYATAAAPTYFPAITRAGSHEAPSSGWGLTTWGRKFPEAALEGSEHASIYRARRFIRLMMPGSRLFDIRPFAELGEMDDASPTNLYRLQVLGREMTGAHEEAMREIVELVKEETSRRHEGSE